MDSLLSLSPNDLEHFVKHLIDDKSDDRGIVINAIFRIVTRIKIELNPHLPIIIKLLLEDIRIDPAYDDNKAIEFALFHEHIDISKLLLSDKRVNPSFRGFVLPEGIRLLNGERDVIWQYVLHHKKGLLKL